MNEGVLDKVANLGDFHMKLLLCHTTLPNNFNSMGRLSEYHLKYDNAATKDCKQDVQCKTQSNLRLENQART